MTILSLWVKVAPGVTSISPEAFQNSKDIWLNSTLVFPNWTVLITLISPVMLNSKLSMFRKKPTQWQENATVHPRLQQLAKKYLCIPVPSERLFSKAGELISNRHNIIDSSQNVNMILFLNKNYI